MEVIKKRMHGQTVVEFREKQDAPVVAARHAVLRGVLNTYSADTEGALPTDGGVVNQISTEAIASYSELLGNGTDYDKTIQEILFIRDHGEPAPDPETGENAWTPAYKELEERVNSETQPAKANAPTNMMSVEDEQDETGIAKTRSMLGLPTIDGLPNAHTIATADEVDSAMAKVNKVNSLSASDLEELTEGEKEALTSIKTYVVDSIVSDAFKSLADEIEAKREEFLDSLKHEVQR